MVVTLASILVIGGALALLITVGPLAGFAFGIPGISGCQAHLGETGDQGQSFGEAVETLGRCQFPQIYAGDTITADGSLTIYCTQVTPALKTAVAHADTDGTKYTFVIVPHSFATMEQVTHAIANDPTLATDGVALNEWGPDPAHGQVDVTLTKPTTRTFATKPQLAQQMLARAFAAAVPAQWVVGDSVYGSEDLRHWLEAQGKAYLFAVTSTHALWEQGEQIGAADLVALHPELGWVRWSAGEGSQGPRRSDWAWMRLPYTRAPGMVHWLLIRRSLSLPEEYAYYRVYGPEATSLAELVAVAGQRWQIEVAFEGAKGEVGLDEYEVRLWQAWYRHITLALLAYAALVVARSATAKGGHRRL